MDCYSFWTFSDIFEEAGFSSVPFHGGFGLLNIHGIPKPSYRAFQLLSRLNGDQLGIEKNEASPTVDCVASRSPNEINIMSTNHNVPRAPIQAEKVSVFLNGIKEVQYKAKKRIDDSHANPKKAWMEMGSPVYLDSRQIEKLVKASEMTEETVELVSHENGCMMELEIQPHSVLAVSLGL